MRHYVGGGLLAGLGILVLIGALISGSTSPRGWINSHYKRTAAGTYQAPGHPTKVAGDIARRFRPTDRAYDPSGVFLRYPEVVVAVLPAAGGSRVLVDSSRRGYARWYGYVGGRWGGPGGSASFFRGGGPGDGK